MLTSLMKTNPAPFNHDAFQGDFRKLNPAEQERAASKLAARAKTAELERDGMADMTVSAGVDAVAIAAAAFITGRTQAARDRAVAEWMTTGAAADGKDVADYPTPWYSGSEAKNPTGVMGWGWLPKSLAVPVVFAISGAFDWTGSRYSREATYVSLLFILGDWLREVTYKKRLESLDKEAEEEAAA